MKNRFEINEIVGFRGFLDHCFGRVLLAQMRDGRWWYLLDESSHAISRERGTFLVANAMNYHDRSIGIGPGLAFSCGWWPETKLKRRAANVVCKCRWCRKYRRRG